MSTSVPDFTDADQGLVADLLRQRYGKSVPLEAAESELRLDVGSDVLTVCPTLYWTERGAQFVVCKVGVGRYRRSTASSLPAMSGARRTGRSASTASCSRCR